MTSVIREHDPGTAADGVVVLQSIYQDDICVRSLRVGKRKTGCH